MQDQKVPKSFWVLYVMPILLLLHHFMEQYSVLYLKKQFLGVFINNNRNSRMETLAETLNLSDRLVYTPLLNMMCRILLIR